MPTIKQKIAPCLWFDTQAEEAATFYTSVFKNSRINHISRYGEAGREVHGKKAGTVMVVAFEIEGLAFTALNGGPQFKFSPAISLIVDCPTQAEVDGLWDRLGEGGKPGQCGWLTDKFGVSWQIVPSLIPRIIESGDAATIERVMRAIMPMTKLDIAKLQQAYEAN